MGLGNGRDAVDRHVIQRKRTCRGLRISRVESKRNGCSECIELGGQLYLVPLNVRTRRDVVDEVEAVSLDADLRTRRAG